MSKGKKASLPPWFSDADGGKEKKFVRVGLSQLQHPAFLSLNYAAKYLYLCMRMEGEPIQQFTFPASKYRKAGLSDDGFQKALGELVGKGFIDIVQKNGNLRKANIYAFSSRWRTF